MHEAVDKASVLIEALPYIQRFRDAVVVVKVGGSAMEDAGQVDGILADITFMGAVGMRPVVVHGGGKAISRRMAGEGIEPAFRHGLRVTCERTMRVVERVIKGEVNPMIVRGLIAKGARARSLHGDEVLRVQRKTAVDPDTGELIDWGFVGEPGEVDTRAIQALLDEGFMPVITPLGLGPDHQVHNVNADVAAAAIARALPARKLVFLSDVPGLCRDRNDPESVVPSLRVPETERLMADGTISGGMLPKIRSCIEALRAGVCKVHMIDGRQRHSLLLEIFTDKGVGTEILGDG